MRNLLALVGLVVVLFVGFGYSRGWFTVASTNGNFTIQVDKTKTEKDIKAGIQEGSEWIKEHKGTPSTAPSK